MRPVRFSPEIMKRALDLTAFDLAAFVARHPPRAAAFIVTLYGDVVVPRGGELGMGAIIEVCAGVGISETLVRTAVSRLVAAGQVVGAKQGRRSFYRLTPAAAAEFTEAARVIYGPPVPAGWRLVAGPAVGLERWGYARLRAGLWLGADRGPLPPGVAAVAGPVQGQGSAWAPVAAELWDLAGVAAGLAAVRDRYAGLVGVAPALGGAQALALRLLLVHDWRRAVLADPGLPEGALPADWPGGAARGVFGALYRALSPAAEGWVGVNLDNAAGRLPAMTEATRARALALDVSQKSP